MNKGVVLRIAVAGLAVSCAGGGREGSNTVPSKTIEEVLASHNDSLMALPGVVGTAIGLCDSVPCIRVFLRDSSAAIRDRVPARLEGYLVKPEVSGPFHAR